MFDSLAAAVEALEVPAGPDALAALLRIRDRFEARVVEAAGQLDADGLWGLDGATSLTAWLRHRGDLTSREAAHLARTAKTLRSLPVTAAAYGDGRLSTGQVGAIVANLSERTTPLFAEHEASVLPALLPLPTADVARAMQTWRAHADALLDDPDAPEEVRELFLSRSLDGRSHGSMTLDAEGAAVVGTALRLAETKDAEGEPVRSAARRRADALVDLARFFLDHQRTKKGGRHRPHVNVVVTLDELEARSGGRLVDGTELSPSTVEALLCDCAIHRVVTDGASTILDYGRATRTVPPNLWAALVQRDGGCRVDGCDRGPDWCDAHHVVPWEDGGPTSIDNTVLKCSRHHHQHHRAGWRDELLPDGTYVVTSPDGRRWRTRPPGALPVAWPEATDDDPRRAAVLARAS